MFDTQMHMVSTALAKVVAEASGGGNPESAWDEAQRALALSGAKEPELAGIVEARNVEALATVVAEWKANKRHLPEPDREVLKRAMKAFRKTLKVTRLDAESSIGGGPMSSGRHSTIVGMKPPARYPNDVWEELARQKRLVAARFGQYELPPGEE